VLLSCLATIVASAVLAPVATAKPAERVALQLEAPDPAASLVLSSLAHPRRTRSLTFLAGSRWGGRYTASTGEAVTVYTSDAYPVDQAVGQRWADFLAGLIHGPELARVTVYLVHPSEIPEECGDDAAACYDPSTRTIVTPGEDTPDGPTAEAALLHEYGHHLAHSRSNAPWPAVEWGTKRWATALGVCGRVRAGTLFPGGSAERYRLSPAEGVAESYRVLHERRAGVATPLWTLLDGSLYPSEAALRALELDVTTPWERPALTTFRGNFARTGPATRTFRVATPLDGTMVVSTRAPSTVSVSLQLLAPTGTTIVTSGLAGQAPSLTTDVCGQRTVTVRVRRVKGSGPFTLQVSRP